MGLYTEILGISAPEEANAGQTVSVVVVVKALSYYLRVMVVGVPEYSSLPSGVYITGLGPNEAIRDIPAAEWATFGGYFTMPSEDVRVHVYVYYLGGDNYYHLDSEATQVVKLAGGPTAPSISEFKISDYLKV